MEGRKGRGFRNRSQLLTSAQNARNNIIHPRVSDADNQQARKSVAATARRNKVARAKAQQARCSHLQQFEHNKPLALARPLCPNLSVQPHLALRRVGIIFPTLLFLATGSCGSATISTAFSTSGIASLCSTSIFCLLYSVSPNTTRSAAICYSDTTVKSSPSWLAAKR